MTDSLLIKPAGPDCNLTCGYCFYLEKKSLYPGKNRMDLSIAENIISQLMKSGEPATFSWQGGEPTLMGLDFFQEIIGLQKKYGRGGQKVTNTIQTNGLLLDKEWAKFLGRYNFLVGLSLDGPRDLHDAYRTRSDGEGSFEEVMSTVQTLKDHGVQFNVLTVLNSRTVKQPRRIVNFFLQNDLSYLQFIPAIETEGTTEGHKIASFSPTPREIGEFLDELFKKWSESFPPRFSVRYFDSLINSRLGNDPGICKIDATCGSYLVVENNGDVYPCDFYVEEEWKLGNLNETPLTEIEEKDKFHQFAENKTELSKDCRRCDILHYCYGGCQSYRGLSGGPDKKSYMCKAYRYFFSRNMEAIEKIAERVKNSGYRPN